MTPSALAAGGALQAFIVQVLAFALLLVILIKFVKPVLGKALGDRSKGIEDSFVRLEKETADAHRELETFKHKLANADQESKERTEKTLAEANRTRDQILAEAQAQAKAALEKAQREIQIERDKAVLELREEAAQLTLLAADHLAQSAMNDSIQNRLVDGYITKLDAVKKS